jgi:probable rRNA maturation factor
MSPLHDREAPPGGPVELSLLNPNRYPEAAARKLRPWLTRLLEALAPGAADEGVSFAARFVGDREMRRIYRQFRGLDKTTDVLSFPGEAGPDGTHLGDVLISVPRARAQAAAAGHPVERELKVLLLHGLLHCLGYDHESDQGEMETLERRLRRRWIPREAIGDAG